jgi:mRNA interferase MazF
MRGDVHALASQPRRRGHEQRGQRYAVVLQGDSLAALSTVVVAPTSARALDSAFRPRVEVRGKATRVLVEQLAAVDSSRLGRRVGRLAWDEMASVDEALRIVFGLI